MIVISRQGPGISLEIETRISALIIAGEHRVARGLASRLRLKHDTSCIHLRVNTSVARGLASRLRLKHEHGQAGDALMQCRQGPGISLEIETMI